jgi:hypothetical protein
MKHKEYPSLSMDGGMLGSNASVSTSMTLFYALNASYAKKLQNKMSSIAQDYRQKHKSIEAL